MVVGRAAIGFIRVAHCLLTTDASRYGRTSPQLCPAFVTVRSMLEEIVRTGRRRASRDVSIVLHRLDN